VSPRSEGIGEKRRATDGDGVCADSLLGPMRIILPGNDRLSPPTRRTMYRLVRTSVFDLTKSARTYVEIHSQCKPL